MIKMDERSQTTPEYLLILGTALIILAATITLMLKARDLATSATSNSVKIVENRIRSYYANSP